MTVTVTGTYYVPFPGFYMAELSGEPKSPEDVDALRGWITGCAVAAEANAATVKGAGSRREKARLLASAARLKALAAADPLPVCGSGGKFSLRW